MSEKAVLEHGTELSSVSSYRSSFPLIHSLSEDSTTQPQKHSSECTPRSTPKQFGRDKRGLFEGWKFTAFLAFIASVVVLLFNVMFLIYTAARSQRDGEMTLLKGDCEVVHRWSTAMHWLINLLGTIMLSASNFGMQCLIAPTRKDIDRAHQKGSWLDVGVPSLHNLFGVSWKRSFLWLILCLSSLPFHLFYNSAIYYKTAVPAYDVFAGPGSLHRMNWADVRLKNRSKTSAKGDSLKGLVDAAKNGTLHYLDKTSCIAAFGQTYQTTYGKLLLATEEIPQKDSYVLISTNPVYNPQKPTAAEAMRPYPWICPPGEANLCNYNGTSGVQKLAEQKGWTVGVQWNFATRDISHANYSIQHCLAEPVAQQCSLQYSLSLTTIIIASNIVKMIILLHLWLGATRRPVLTIGDAIASFLRRNDPYSRRMCLPSDGNAIYIHPLSVTLPSLRTPELRRPAIYTGKRRRWGSTVSTRWAFLLPCWIFFTLAVVCAVVLSTSPSDTDTDIWKAKLGAITSQTIVSADQSSKSFVASSIVANLPQLLFSFLYVSYNSILTSMCVSAEWSRFCHHRKGLRVSHDPRSSQRSNYFLSIPYRYAVPLIMTSAVLHWLVAESLFKIAIEAYSADLQRDPAQDVYACGWSPVAIVAGLAVSAVMFTCLIVMSLRRFDSGMPVAGSCSLAIAAACHPKFDPNTGDARAETINCLESEDEDQEMGLLPVQWGSTPVSGPIGHCSFSSGDVDPPEQGQEYQ